MPKSYQALFALATLLVSDVAGFTFTYPKHGVDDYVFRDGDTVIVNWEPQILLPEIYLSCGPKANVLANTHDNTVETQVAFRSVYPGQPFRVDWIPQGNDNTYCTFCAGINQQTCSGVFRLEESTLGVPPKVWHAQHRTKTHAGHHSPTGTGEAQPSSTFPSSATGASGAASSGTGSGLSSTILPGSLAPYSNSSTAAVPTTILSSAAAASSSTTSSSDPPSDTGSALSPTVVPGSSSPTVMPGAAASSSTNSAAASTTIVASYFNPTAPSNTAPTGSFNTASSNLTSPSVPQNPPSLADTTTSALLQKHSAASSLMEYMSFATIGISVVTALVLFTL